VNAGRAATIVFATLAAGVPLSTGDAAPSPWRAGSLCKAREAVVYSCRIGRKLASVCAGSGEAHYRFGPAARPEVDIASAPDWDNVRIGLVTGQGGGSQHHIRFTLGDSHYVVFHGIDGQLADRPGRTYSGVSVVSGPVGEREGAVLDCRRGARIDPRFEDSLAAHAPEAVRDRLEEPAGSAFDRWY